MVTFTVVVGDEGFSRLAAGLDVGAQIIRDESHDALADAVQLVESAALDRVPHRTGRLSESIGSKVQPFGASWLGGVGVKTRGAPYGGAGADVALDIAPYAAAVELGADVHEIRPKGGHTIGRGRKGSGKRALWWQGARHPVRRVSHPGQRGQHFLRDALLDNEQQVRELIHQSLQTALRRIKNGGA